MSSTILEENGPTPLEAVRAKVDDLSKQLASTPGYKPRAKRQSFKINNLAQGNSAAKELQAEIDKLTSDKPKADDKAGLAAECSQAIRDRNAAYAERDRAVAERDQAYRDRDAALDRLVEMDRISAERDTATKRSATLDSVTSERDEAKKRVGELEQEIANIPAPAEALRLANQQVELVSGQLLQTKNRLEQSEINVGRLERFCGVKGIDPKNAPIAANDENHSSGASLYEQYESLQGAQRTAFFRKHEAALMGYAQQEQAAAKNNKRRF